LAVSPDGQRCLTAAWVGDGGVGSLVTKRKRGNSSGTGPNSSRRSGCPSRPRESPSGGRQSLDTLSGSSAAPVGQNPCGKARHRCLKIRTPRASSLLREIGSESTSFGIPVRFGFSDAALRFSTPPPHRTRSVSARRRVRYDAFYPQTDRSAGGTIPRRKAISFRFGFVKIWMGLMACFTNSHRAESVGWFGSSTETAHAPVCATCRAVGTSALASVSTS
jgi:hypothetical protein